MDQLHELERQEGTPTDERAQSETRASMSYADFLNHLEDSTHAEWVNGEAIIFMPPSIRHQDMVVFLLTLIDGFVKIFDLGKTLTAPCEMRFDATGTSREPDILFLATNHFDRLSENRLTGPADLVIEVISTESASRDRNDKFYEYQANGVREYWIIDPRPGLARSDFWILDARGVYQPIPIQPNGIYHSTVLPDFKLDANGLLAEELPSPLKALANMVGMDTLMRSLGSDE